MSKVYAQNPDQNSKVPPMTFNNNDVFLDWARKNNYSFDGQVDATRTYHRDTYSGRSVEIAVTGFMPDDETKPRYLHEIPPRNADEAFWMSAKLPAHRPQYISEGAQY